MDITAELNEFLFLVEALTVTKKM